MKKMLLSAAAAVAIMSGSAIEADMVAPEPAPVVDWTGFYAGVHGGWAWADTKGEYLDNDANFDCFEENSDFGAGCAADIKADGPFVGGQVGFNLQLGGGFVLGAEGDYAGMGLHDDEIQGDPTENPPGPADTWLSESDLEIDQLASIRARIGFAMDDFMPFITGGYAWAHAERKVNNDFVGILSDENWHEGWTIGGGLEYLVSEHWSVKAEYRYYDFGSETYLPNPITGGVDMDFDMHTVQVGVNFHLM
jgi:outer membrane immunogenic protein